MPPFEHMPMCFKSTTDSLCSICGKPFCCDVFQKPHYALPDTYEINFELHNHDHCHKTAAIITDLQQQLTDLEWKFFNLQMLLFDKQLPKTN